MGEIHWIISVMTSFAGAAQGSGLFLCGGKERGFDRMEEFSDQHAMA
jgi:hypothetical protein